MMSQRKKRSNCRKFRINHRLEHESVSFILSFNQIYRMKISNFKEKSNVSPSPKIKKKRRLFEENNGKINPIILSYSQLFHSTRRDSYRKTSRARLAFYPPIQQSTQTLSDINSRRSESTTSTSISIDKSQISSTKSMPLPRKSKLFPIKHQISEE